MTEENGTTPAIKYFSRAQITQLLREAVGVPDARVDFENGLGGFQGATVYRTMPIPEKGVIIVVNGMRITMRGESGQLYEAAWPYVDWRKV